MADELILFEMILFYIYCYFLTPLPIIIKNLNSSGSSLKNKLLTLNKKFLLSVPPDVINIFYF